MRLRSRGTARRSKALAGVLAIGLVASACGGSKSGDKQPDSLKEEGLDAAAGESGLKDAGKPVRGGKLTYGLEADTNGGFCLSEGQLAISGMMVVRAVYDTLTVPNKAGDYVPYLAKAITPSDDYKQWKIELRPNIKFHDGSPLTAEVVKNNIDAYRGTYKGRSSLLFGFVLSNIKDVKVSGDLEVTVTMNKPWVAFPSFLYSSSRVGIMGQKQLDSDNCKNELVGTGPFKFKSWKVNDKFTAVRNANYWQIAPDGKPYPYVESLEFQPITDGEQRNKSLRAGDINIMHTSNAKDIGTTLKKLRDQKKVNMFVSEEAAEVAFLQLNVTIPPFNDINMRKAMAMAADREGINKLMNAGLPTIANGPISVGTLGYLKDTGFPDFNAAEARKLVDAYKAKGGKPEFTLTATTDQTVQQLAQLVQQKGKAIGVNVKIASRDQASLINDAIAHNYQAMTFRNYPGGDPDSLYVWFYSGTKDDAGKFQPNLVNFSGIKDSELDRLLDEGRSEPDKAKRKKIYEDFNRRMASQVYEIWTWYTPWAIVTGPNVHGIVGPQLPGEDASKPGPAEPTDDDLKPNEGLATGHSLLGLWVAN